MKLEYVDGELLRQAIINGAKVLEKNKKHVDSLNVFPVPDGDTGTNMSLTMMAAVTEVNKVEKNNVYEIASAASNGALRGARGNSGVILSQLLRGFTKGLQGLDKVNTKQLSQAFTLGSETAYKAVMKPTEGTMLTIAREGSDYSVEIAKKEKNIIEFFSRMIKKSEEVLEKTPDMLPVLKEAGVVDAGGKGLILIFIGMLNAINGDLEDYEVITEYDSSSNRKQSIYQYEEEILFTYCTEFIVTSAQDFSEENIDTFRAQLADYGDSMLVVGDSEVIKVHIHTNNPGKIIEHGIQMGELSSIKIDNMKEQHRDTITEAEQYKELKKNGIVTVSMGEGIKEIFMDLGVDLVISGGQTMNPSAEDIVKAVESVNSENVFIFPNNSNVILSAEQTKQLTSVNVYVIPTKSIPQGIAAMLAYDEELSVEDNYSNMTSAITNIKTGQVTYAVRDSKINGSTIKKGDLLGIYDKDISVVGQNINSVTIELLENMVDENDEIITVLYGEDMDSAEAENLKDQLLKLYPECEIEMLYGGQPVYYYIISIE